MAETKEPSDTCPKCLSIVPISSRECPVCSKSFSFPNVRMADRAVEVEALEARLETAEASSKALGTYSELEAFSTASAYAKAVMNRSYGALDNWINGFSPLFLTYHRQVQAGIRFPSGSEWDEQRSAAEAAINPYCYQELSYAALTLDGIGMTYYGEYSVVLKNITIEERASVFEENPFYFNKRYLVIAGTSPPKGYRANWANRGKLATAKLHLKISPGLKQDSFPEILMDSRRDQPDCDFIEVHIYGPINRAGIEMVTGPAPARKAEKVLWQRMIRSLEKLGIQTREAS